MTINGKSSVIFKELITPGNSGFENITLLQTRLFQLIILQKRKNLL